MDLRKIIPSNTGIQFSTSDEMTEMLQICERLGIEWTSGVNAMENDSLPITCYIRIDEYGKLNYGNTCSVPFEYCRHLMDWHLVKAKWHDIPTFAY